MTRDADTRDAMAPDVRAVSDALDDAKAVLTQAGYVVLKAKSYRAAQERQRLAECQAQAEVQRRESVEAWAHEAFAEQRRLSYRLTFVYGVARAQGASVDELRGDS